MGISYEFVAMIQSRSDHDNIIVSSDLNNNWVTKDCGETWTLAPDHLNLERFKFHPHEPKKILALSRKLCSRYSSKKKACRERNELWYSNNSGLNWKRISTYVYDYVWGRTAYYSFGIGENAVFITKQLDESKS